MSGSARPSPLYSRRRYLRTTALSALLPSLACGSRDRKLLFSGIPDADKSALAERYEEVAAYLSAQLKRPVGYVHVPDYTAAVVALAAGKIDFAWLGGVTAVQAERECPAGVSFVASRESDLHFKSYFIANREYAAKVGLSPRPDRSPQTQKELRKLAPHLAQARFSFGAKNSTSGHVMPRWFMVSDEVGLSPEDAFAGPPAYQRKGGHNATLQAVASGAVDMGVLNYAAWEGASKGLQDAAPVVYVTPEYVDYCIVAHGRLKPEMTTTLRNAFVDLNASVPAQAQVLTAFSAKAFVPVEAEAWDGVRKVLDGLQKGGALR